MISKDLVGHKLTVVEAKNKDLLGITGEVIDETKNTICVRTDQGEKTLLKQQVTFRINGYEIEGSLMTQTPEKRTKLTLKKWQRKKPKNQ